MDLTAEGLAAAGALHVRRPVRYICSLTESMWITTKRHPFDMKVQLGADLKGKLTGYSINFTVNNGAYMSAGQAIINRALYMLSGSYNIPHVEALGSLVYTNDAWGGAARGAGPPRTGSRTPRERRTGAVFPARVCRKNSPSSLCSHIELNPQTTLQT